MLLSTSLRTARRLAAGGVLITAVLLSPTAVDAKTNSARILSPTADALAVKPSLDVKVRVPVGASRVTLRVGGRDVSKALRGSGTTRTAAVNTKKLAPGRTALTLRGRAGGKEFFAHEPVVIGRASASLLKVKPSVAVLRGHAELKLDFAARPSRLRITLNGKRVPVLRSLQPGSSIVSLTADDGLVYGANKVRVRVHDPATGAWDRDIVKFHVGTSKPLAAAGKDQRVTAGASVKLSAAKSRGTRAQEPFGYRWRIVSQPKGANATVKDPTSITPGVRTTKPGRYRIRLELTGRSRRARAAAVASVSASDTVTVDAAASVPPYGLTVNTIDWPQTDGAPDNLSIAGLPINSDGSDRANLVAGALTYVVLDRGTLAVDQAATTLSNPTQASLQSVLSGLTNKQLVIMSGESCCGTSDLSGLGPVKTSAPFSTIFVGDQPTAPIAYNNNIRTSPIVGGLSGVLRAAVSEDGTPGFTFVQTQSVTFDTKGPSPDGGSSIHFDGDKNRWDYPSTGSGVAIVTFQPYLAYNQTHDTLILTGNATTDQQNLEYYAKLLNTLHTNFPGLIVLVQTFGKPKATTAGWGEFGEALYGFGGTPALWDHLDGTGDYGLVGVGRDYGNLDNPADVRAVSAAEASQVASGGSATSTAAPWSGSVRGVLGQGPDGFPIIKSQTSMPVTVSDGQAYGPSDLTTLADAAPQPWPLSDAAHTAALQWISQQLGPIDPSTNKPAGLGDPNAANGGGWCYQPAAWDVRAEFCNTNLTEWASTYTDQLKALTCTDGTGYTQAQCQDVVAELTTEFTAIPTVQKFISNLQAPFQDNQATLTSSFTSAADAVDTSLSVTPPNPDFQLQEMMDLMLGPLQDVDAPEGAEVFPLVMGLLNSAVDAGLNGVTMDNGNPARAAFDDSKDSIGADAALRLTQASTQMGLLYDVLVSDYTKLMTTGARAATVWSIDGLTSASATSVISSAAKQWLYRSMLPVAYTQIQVMPKAGATIDDINGISCLYGSYPAEYTRWPFVPGATPNLSGKRSGGTPLPPSAAYTPPFGTNDDGSYQWASNNWTMGNAIGAESFQQPAQSLTDSVFSPVSSGGIGLNQDEFFTWAWNPAQILQFSSLEKTTKLRSANSCDVN